MTAASYQVQVHDMYKTEIHPIHATESYIVGLVSLLSCTQAQGCSSCAAVRWGAPSKHDDAAGPPVNQQPQHKPQRPCCLRPREDTPPLSTQEQQ